MKKTISILGIAVLSMTTFLVTDVNSSNANLDLANLLAMNTANAEVPDLNSPIWNVKVIVGPSNQLECTTGESYVCKVDW